IWIGLVVGTVCSFGYTLAPNIASIFVLRLFHGAAMACFYPGATTLSTDLAPKGRRAAALSYFSMFLFAGTALGPAIGEGLYHSNGAKGAFAASGSLALAGLVVALFIERTGPLLGSDPIKMPFLHRAAFFPAIVLSMVAFAEGGAEAFVPLYVTAKGNGDSRIFFTTLALTIIFARIFVGRIADRYGRPAVIIPGTALIAVSMYVLASSASPVTVGISAVIFGVGWGLLFPGLFALTMDRVSVNERGSATGTFTAAFDLMFGAGQVTLGWLLEATNFTTIFVVAGSVALGATLLFVSGYSRSATRFPAFPE
ncbi:MAG: MFS transporter, partial [Actinobacteria bacterium]|nr:MFS transporter [Actinomycetota bacterium]